MQTPNLTQIALIAVAVLFVVVPRLWAGMSPTIRGWFAKAPVVQVAADIHAKIDAVKLLALPPDLERAVYLHVVGYGESPK